MSVESVFNFLEIVDKYASGIFLFLVMIALCILGFIIVISIITGIWSTLFDRRY